MPDQPLNPDALANLIAWRELPFGGNPDNYIRLDANAAHAVIEILKPHLAHAQPVVSTLEELDKLPISSVILDADNDAGIVEYDGVIFCETHKLSKAYVFKHYRNLRVIYTPEGGGE